MNRVEQYLLSKLAERNHKGNLRRLTTQRASIDFYSNDYLGLVSSGSLATMLGEMNGNLQKTGSTGSRLLSGNTSQIESLEAEIASFHKAESALLFNSGYDANVGLLSSIASRGTTILYDDLCHASILDGIRLSQCLHKYKFAHNDTSDLEQKMQKYKDAGPVIVIVESVYSMDGDMAPLEKLVDLCCNYSAQLVVDEAHATGVFGTKGEGLVCALQLQDAVFARIHTYGKALGCHGASVAGSNILRAYLINYARPFIFTTALPGHSVAAIACAYNFLSAPHFTNKPLHDLIDYFRHCIHKSGMEGWKDSRSTIQALVVGDNERCKELALSLQQSGLQINAILHPTVPLGMERLRICLHTFNTKAEVDRIFEILKA